jgi:hypothetical protein
LSGDKVKTLINNEDVRFHKFNPTYSEFVKMSDTLITMYIVSYKDDIVVGIDYLYPSRESALKGLKMLLNDVYEIGDGLYLKDNILIVAKQQEIQIRDVRYFNKKYRITYSSQ